MFSIFPDGWSGSGLLLLRIVLGVALTISAWLQLRAGHDLSVATLTLLMLSIIVGILIAVGYRTRVLAAVAAIAILGGAFFVPAPARFVLFENRSTAVLLTVIAASVACVGPGAYSLDSHFFGRREIVIPKSPRPPGSI